MNDLRCCREMLVHWVTLPSNDPVVVWGLVDGSNLDEAAAEGTTYKKEELCGSPANAVSDVLGSISYWLYSLLYCLHIWMENMGILFRAALVRNCMCVPALDRVFDIWAYCTLVYYG